MVLNHLFDDLIGSVIKEKQKNEGIKKWKVFFYNFQDGSWKFGLKDLGLSQSRVSKMNTFPLIGGQESEINLMEEEEEEDIPGKGHFLCYVSSEPPTL